MSSSFSLWVVLGLSCSVWGDLVVNVRNQGGESYKQTIRANLTDETVTLNFDSHDGGSTLMVIDFRNEIQLVHVTRLGDQDENEVYSSVHENSVGDDVERRYRGVGGSKKGRVVESWYSNAVYKSYCFVTKFKQNEFIPVDAMSKLRQKNPQSLRVPERQEPPQNITFDILLDATASDWISPTIREHCIGDGSFAITTYAIKMEISEKAVNPEDYLRSVRDIVVEEDKACGVGTRGACVCSDAVCIGWYPCALKFCRTRNTGSSGNGTVGGGGGVVVPGSTGAPGDGNYKTYRCGIHTCRVCRVYRFGVTGGSECV